MFFSIICLYLLRKIKIDFEFFELYVTFFFLNNLLNLTFSKYNNKI